MMFRSIRPVAAIMAVAIAADLAACGAAPGGGDAAPTIDAGPKLAAGTIPPDGPPKPGEATVGPDGMYDYAAVPHFKPMDPCVGPWREAASRAGFERREGDPNRIPYEMTPMCSLSDRQGNLLLLSGDYRGRAEYGRQGLEIIDNHADGKSWYTIGIPASETSGTCVSGIDTASGVVIASAGYIQASLPNAKEKACQFATSSFQKILGGYND